MVLFFTVLWSKLSILGRTQMNPWISLIVGGIATCISAGVVFYTFCEERRAHKLENSALSREQRKMLSAKPAVVSHASGNPASDAPGAWTISAHANPPSMWGLDAPWLEPRNHQRQWTTVSVASGSTLLHSNRMPAANVRKRSLVMPEDDILLDRLPMQRFA